MSERGKRGCKWARLMLVAMCLLFTWFNGVAEQQDASQSNPRVQIISPQNGATFVKEKIIPITYQAWSPDGTPLIRAEAYVDGIRGDEGLSYNPPTTSIQETLEWDATFFRDGPHTITIRVFDAHNRMGEASVTIYKGADTTKPKAEILSPKSGSVVKGVVAIIARFEDDRQLTQVGVRAISQDARQKHSIIYARGGVLRERIYEATVFWDTTLVTGGSPVFPDGLYILQAWAVDGQGQEGVSPEVLVTVRNQVAEAVIQRPQVPPRSGQSKLAEPTNGAVIITRPMQPGDMGTLPKQPPSEITIIPAPIPPGIRQLPTVELSAARLAVSRALQQLLSTPLIRGESTAQFTVKSYEPYVAPLELGTRGKPSLVISLRPLSAGEMVSSLVGRGESITQLIRAGYEPYVASLELRARGLGIGLPPLAREVRTNLRGSEIRRVRSFQVSRFPTDAKAVMLAVKPREVANISRMAMLSSPGIASVDRRLNVERDARLMQPEKVALPYSLRPIAAISAPKLGMSELAIGRAETIQKPIKPATPDTVWLNPTKLPLASRYAAAGDMKTVQAMRAYSVEPEVTQPPKPRAIPIITEVSPVEPHLAPPRLHEPLVSGRGEAAQMCSSYVSKALPAIARTYVVSAPMVARLAAYGIASVKPSGARMPIASTLPKQVEVRKVPLQQPPAAALPSHSRAQVARAQVALPDATPTKRSRMVDVGILRRTPAALPTIHSRSVREQTRVIIARRKMSFTYTVQPGDTLCSLARKFGLTLRQLMDANNLHKPVKLRRGQMLVIPHMPILVRCSGQTVDSDVQPYLFFGVALTPFRAIVEFAGGSVDWISGERKVFAQWDGKQIHLRINHPAALINDEQVLLKPPPFLLLNRTIVPARLFERVFDVPVVWNEREGVVEIGLALKETQTRPDEASTQEAQK